MSAATPSGEPARLCCLLHMPTGVYRAEWRAGEGRLRVLLQWDACEGDDGGEAAGGAPVAGGEATHFALLIDACRPPDLSRLDSSRRLLDFENATSLPAISRADWTRNAADPTSSGAVGRCHCWRLVFTRDQLSEQLGRMAARPKLSP